MHRYLVCCAIAIVLTLAGCSQGGSPTPHAPQPLTASVDAESTLPVRILVVTRTDGTGNPLWTKGYIAELLDTASAMTGHTAVFTLASNEAIANDRAYASTQEGLLPTARSLARPGVLTILVSRPDTEDYAGLTDQAGPKGSRAPFLIMRSRHTTWEGINATAAILLHELGHQMGLHHKPEAFLDDGHIHTDDWWTRDEGLALLETSLMRVRSF